MVTLAGTRSRSLDRHGVHWAARGGSHSLVQRERCCPICWSRSRRARRVARSRRRAAPLLREHHLLRVHAEPRPLPTEQAFRELLREPLGLQERGDHEPAEELLDGLRVGRLRGQERPVAREELRTSRLTGGARRLSGIRETRLGGESSNGHAPVVAARGARASLRSRVPGGRGDARGRMAARPDVDGTGLGRLPVARAPHAGYDPLLAAGRSPLAPALRQGRAGRASPAPPLPRGARPDPRRARDWPRLHGALVGGEGKLRDTEHDGAMTASARPYSSRRDRGGLRAGAGSSTNALLRWCRRYEEGGALRPDQPRARARGITK